MNRIEEQRVRLAGMGAADIAWLDGFGWDPTRLPLVTAENVDEFRRREAMLNHSIAELTLPERANSIEGKLAAEIGALLADMRDEAENDDND